MKSAEKDNLKHESEPGKISRAGVCGETGSKEIRGKEISGCRGQKTVAKPEHNIFTCKLTLLSRNVF